MAKKQTAEMVVDQSNPYLNEQKDAVLLPNGGCYQLLVVFIR